MRTILVVVSLLTSLTLFAAETSEKGDTRGKTTTCVAEPSSFEASYEQFSHASTTQKLASEKAMGKCKARYSQCRILSCK